MRLRVGVPPLLALSRPLNHAILAALGDGEVGESDLLDGVRGGRSACFRHLGELEGLGAIERLRRPDSRHKVCVLREPAGGELIALADLLTDAYGGAAGAPAAARGLAAGWNTAALRWLGEEPCGVSHLNRLAPIGVGMAEVEACCDALVECGFAERRGAGRAVRLALTGRADRAGRPIAAAVAWHLRHMPGGAGLQPLDAEGLLFLLARRLRPPGDVAGQCALLMDGLATVHVGFRRGRALVVEVSAPDQHDGAAWLGGSPEAWLAALAAGDIDGLGAGGEIALAEAVRATVAAAPEPDSVDPTE